MKKNTFTAVACIMALNSISSAAFASNRVGDINQRTQVARSATKNQLLSDIVKAEKELNDLYAELEKASESQR